MDEETFMRGMLNLLMVWPHRAPDQATVDALCSTYRPALAGLTAEQWAEAVMAAAASLTHFPVPAELLDLAQQAADRARFAATSAETAARLAEMEAAPRQLPERGAVVRTPEEREAWLAYLREQTRAMMREASAREVAAQAARRREDRPAAEAARQRPVYGRAAEAEAVLEQMRASKQRQARTGEGGEP